MRLQPGLELLDIFVAGAEFCSKFFGAEPFVVGRRAKSVRVAEELFQGLLAIGWGVHHDEHTARWERIGNRAAIVFRACKRMQCPTQRHQVCFVEFCLDGKALPLGGTIRAANDREE